MQFKIDLKIFLFFIIYYFTKQIETYLVIMVFAIVHEMGHLIVGLILGLKPNNIRLMPYGLSISFKMNTKEFNKKIFNGNLLEVKKIIIAIAGPLMNFIIILISSKLKINIFYKLMIIYSNFLILFFNLIPIYPLDGGRIIKGFLPLSLGRKYAEKIINIISFITLLIITFFTAIGVCYTKNLSILFIIFFLWILYINQYVIYKKRKKIYNLIEKTIEIEGNK